MTAAGASCIAADSTVVVRRGPGRATQVKLSTLADVRLGDVILVRVKGRCCSGTLQTDEPQTYLLGNLSRRSHGTIRPHAGAAIDPFSFAQVTLVFRYAAQPLHKAVRHR